MLKILQARLQQHMNRELPDVQAGFRKGRGTRDQYNSVNISEQSSCGAQHLTAVVSLAVELGLSSCGTWA